MELRVVKLGGSLLAWPELVPRLRQWFRDHPRQVTLLVIGGGGIVDAVRSLDHIHRFPAETAHWLCVSLLSQTTRLAHELLPEFQLLSTAEQLDGFLGEAVESQAGCSRIALVDVQAFYHAGNSHPALTADWNTTTDSIAALLACEQSATELVLLKSTSPTPDQRSLRDWAEAGIVDACFPAMAGRLPRVTLVNLRDKSAASRTVSCYESGR